ncbi:MAG TPA: hypothetical protein DDY70_04405 [Clostridiales bacterium]|nr:hypothetical protein [Clostridiales bacterium]
MKECFEWIGSWCDHTEKEDLPRVLLIGDSITRSYQESVRTLLSGICYVDYIATSYAIDTSFYYQLIRGFSRDSRYDLIHFNHGLHGIYMTREVYEERLRELLCDLRTTGAGLVLATTTVAYESGNCALSAAWMPRIRERNDAVYTVASELSLPIDDLFRVSLDIPAADRSQDGIHYMEGGVRRLAGAVAESIKNNLKK